MPEDRFDPELADEICRYLASGHSLRAICRMPGMPAESTVRHWAVVDREGFFAQYARARETQVDSLAEEIIDIVDEEDDPVRARVRMDARKWFASKILPKKYGERIVNEHTGADGKDLLPAAQDSQRLAAVLIAAFTGALPKPEGD